MNVTPPESYTNLIKDKISQALRDPNANPIAAFDADGTCWFSDVGRDFFDHQIKKKFFADQPYTWDDYQKLEDIDIKDGLLWLAKILSGFKLEEVRAFGRDFNLEVRPNFVEHQKKIIQFLIDAGVQVYIVTASVKWTVEAAAQELGIPADNVIGVETFVENGIITDKPKGHMTWKEGKVKALLDKTGGKAPFFASGNTTSDVPLLHLSTHISQVMHATHPRDAIYQSEREALAIAKSEGWHYLDYMKGEFK